MIVRVISFHAAYRCRHSGACCTASWPIPVEADRLSAMHAAVANGRLRPADFMDAATPDAPPLLRSVKGQCVFFDADLGRTCRVHSAIGHDALPLACRQFPRVVVSDPRGVSVVLSHFCPTAAAMLEESPDLKVGGSEHTEPRTFRSGVTIVENPAGFPSDGEYVGLDARESLPPLLRPEVLMDWESWWAFERLAVEMLANSTAPPAATLTKLRGIVDAIRTWSPGQGALIARVEEAFRKRPLGSFSGCFLNRFLAAHAFGSWIAHLGGGLRTWLHSLDVALALAEEQGVRHADLRLRHLEDPWALAERWSEAAGEAATTLRSRRAGRATRS